MNIAVIGAGPAGLSFASKYGDADVFEEHKEVGLPRHCTGLVSGSAARRVGIPNSLILNQYRELTVTDLEGRRIYFKMRDSVLLVDRPGLEQWLAEGVRKLYLGKRVVNISKNYIYTSDGSKHGPYDYIVLAEGSARRFARAYGHVVRLPGLQVDVKSSIDIHGIIVVYNQKLSKAYFSWIVELDRGVFRVGLADVCCTVEKLNKLVKLINGQPIDKPFGGGVLAGPPLKRLITGRVTLVGDAAGFVKPLSGGGITLAIYSSQMAAKAIARGTPTLYEDDTLLLRLRLRTAFLAFRILYGWRFVERAIHLLNGGEYVAVDYDDHIKTLLAAALTDPRSIRVVKELLRYLASNRNIFHLF